MPPHPPQRPHADRVERYAPVYLRPAAGGQFVSP
jgi:hypothetical protein